MPKYMSRFGSLAGTIALAAMLVLAFLSLCTTPASAEQVNAHQDGAYAYAPGRLLVRFTPQVKVSMEKSSLLTSGLPTLDALLAAQHVRTAASLFGEHSPLSQIYLLELPADADVLSAVDELAKSPYIEWAEPDYLAYAAAVPNDPLLSQQWALDQISAPAAWDVVTGAPAVVIAVLDSGIDVDHPDLDARLWTNPGETPGNGIDDDGNGHVDDLRGWNFIAQTNEVDDDDGHGTQVAGAAVAETDNGAGVAGVCWNCRVMAVKVMQPGGVANYSDIALGVYYAADKGAEVINLSLGGYANSNTLRAAIEAAAQGAVIVAAAGDDNSNDPFYPAAYPGVLAVGAATSADTRAVFSNYGDWVDAAAPGVNITTTLNGGSYGPADGTSLSAPLVSGLAGLVWTQHPDWTPALVQAQVLQTADPIGADGLGSGRINAAAAVTLAPHPLLEITATAINDDLLGRPDPGAVSALAVTIGNDWLDALGVTGTLTTADPYVTVITGTASFGDIASSERAAGSPAFGFEVASGAGYNHPILFTLSLWTNGGVYTATLPLTITTVSANQTFCGTIASDQTWTSDKTYIINCNVGIAPGRTLTIQPGTVVKFNGNYSLNVGGQLVADGTEQQPIRFMSNTTGTWGRIYFDTTSIDAAADISGTYQSGSILRWVHIESASQGIGCNSATPYLSHVTTDGGGVSCTLGTSPLQLHDSSLTGNASFLASFDEYRVSYSTPGWATGVTASGNYLYVAATSAGMRIINVSDPAQPVEVGDLGSPSVTAGITISGTYAYVAEYDAGLRIVDISNPASPVVVGLYDTPGIALDTAVAGDYVYLADHTAGLRVIDASEPMTPTEVGYYETPGDAQDVTISGHYVYVADYAAGLRVVDVSDPAHPVEVAAYDTLGDAQKVVIVGDYAFVADHAAGLRVIDISDPENPFEAGYYDTPGDAWGLAIWGSRAYVADNNTTLRVIDISDPTNPVEVGSYAASGNLQAIAISNYVLYGAVGTGVDIYCLGCMPVISNSTFEGDLNLPARSELDTSTVTGNVAAEDESSIRHTISMGSITINGSASIENSTAPGIVVYGAATVLTNTVAYGGIRVGDDSLVQGNNVENAPAWGIIAGINSTVSRNRVIGAANGVDAGGVIQENLIANSSGVGLQITGGTLVISNTLTGNKGSAMVIASGTPVIHGNNLEFNTGAYDLVNNTGNGIDAANNWWGTTDSGIIDARIFDSSDDYTLGAVSYASAAAEAVQTAPAYVRGLTLNPGSPVGIETVTFDVLFSTPMDVGSQAATEFHPARKNTWQSFTTSNSGLAQDQVMAAVVDSEGRTWLGTYNAGVSVLSADGSWQTYTTANSGLASNYIRTIIIDSGGKIWFGTNGGGVSVLSPDNTWQTYNKSNSGLSNNTVQAIAIDPEGNVWLGTGGGGVSVLGTDNTWWTYHAFNSGLANNNVFTMAIDLAGNVWFGFYGYGASVLHPDGSWETYTKSNSGLPDDRVWTIHADLEGNVRFGFGSFLFGTTVLYPDGTWKTFTASNSGLASNGVSSIVEDAAGNIWFGHSSGGASLLRTDGIWLRYNTANSGLVTNNIWKIVLSPTGDRWFLYGTPGDVYYGASVLYGGAEYLIDRNATWTSPTHRQASYDFSALIPRGVYGLTIAGAMGADGMEIAPNTAYTLTVDYLGTPDTTIPAAPTVRACASDSTTTLSVSWTVPPTQTIGLYRYAVGSAPGLADVTNWVTTTLTTVNRDNLNLLDGQTYYVSVQARNTGGIWSEAGVSNLVVAGAGGCPGADFSAAPLSGMSPLSVTFTPTVTGTVTAYAWSFGDGAASTLPGPAHAYWTPGVYTATLDIYGPGGWTRVVKPDYIAVAPDTVPPTGTVSINDGAVYVTVMQVALGQAIIDPSGLADMRFSNDHVTWSSWEAYNPAKTWGLLPGDGLKTVYAQVRDMPGNVATFSDGITLDSTPPNAAVTALPAFVGTQAFTVTWSGGDVYAGLESYDVQVRVGAGSWTDWFTETVQTAALFTGTHGQAYSFRARARDVLGNLGQYAAGGDTQTTIDLDAPTGDVLINGGDVYANNQAVTLTLNTSDLSGVVDYQASNDGVSYSGWLSYTANALWSLAAGEGEQPVYVRYRDLVGHVSMIYTDTIVLDTISPNGAITINDDAVFTNNPAVTLTLAASDALSGISQVRLSNDGSTWSDWEPYAAAKAWILTDGDGLKTVYVQYGDNAGNIAAYDDTITLDVTPPTTAAVPSGTAGDDGWWRSPVTVTLSAFDATSGVEHTVYQVDGGDWHTYSTPVTVAGDGVHTVEYNSADLVGNAGLTQTQGLNIDTLAPVISATISGSASGEWYTSDVQVTLSALDDTSGVSLIQYRWNSGPWLAYTDTLVLAADGIATLEYQARDAAGNASVVQSVELRRDTTPPGASVAALTPYQPTLAFIVDWTGSDALSGVDSFDIQVSDNGGAWIDWLTATTALSGTFTGLDGHTFDFRARARDVLGNLGQYSLLADATTHVDTARPENGIAINGGAADTTGVNVQLVLLANGASQAAFSTNGVDFTSWEAFPSTFEVRSFTLPAGDGVKTVWVRYLDFYGQVVTCSDTIVLNTSLTGDDGVSINDDVPLTEQVTVTLTLKAPPGVQDMLISNSSRFIAAQWEPYSATRSWVLAYYPGVSVYQVYVKFRSLDGTVSERYDDIITLDLVDPPPPIDSLPPSGSLVINAGAASTGALNVSLDMLAADGPGGVGVRWMYFREWKYDPVAVQWVTVRSSGWLPYADTAAWTLSDGTGMKYVGAWFADAANNVSNPVVVDSINLVLPGDTLGEQEITQYRQTFTPGETVTVTLSVTNGDADLYIWRPGGTGAPAYWSNQPGTADEQLVFTALEGEYLIEVHGYASATFTLDVVPSGSGGGLQASAGDRPLVVDLLAYSMASNKPLPPRPLVTTYPGEAQPPSEQPDTRIFLPIVRK